jgi:peptide deformylase
MKRTILTYPDPLLAEKTEHVQEISKELMDLANDMVETMYESDGIGLAARSNRMKAA